MWDCIHCNKEIEDTQFMRSERLRSRYVRGEMFFCLDCANERVDRVSGKLKPYPVDLEELKRLTRKPDSP